MLTITYSVTVGSDWSYVYTSESSDKAFAYAKRRSAAKDMGAAAVYRCCNDARKCVAAYLDGEFHKAPSGTEWGQVSL